MLKTCYMHLCLSTLDILNSIEYKSMGPSIYDVHTEGEGGQAQVDACGRRGGSSLMLTSTQKIKIRGGGGLAHVDACGQGKGPKSDFFVDVKWMAPIQKVLPFCPCHFVHTIFSNTILSVYCFVHTILSVIFCPVTPVVFSVMQDQIIYSIPCTMSDSSLHRLQVL